MGKVAHANSMKVPTAVFSFAAAPLAMFGYVLGPPEAVSILALGFFQAAYVIPKLVSTFDTSKGLWQSLTERPGKNLVAAFVVAAAAAGGMGPTLYRKAQMLDQENLKDVPSVGVNETWLVPFDATGHSCRFVKSGEFGSIDLKGKTFKIRCP